MSEEPTPWYLKQDHLEWISTTDQNDLALRESEAEARVALQKRQQLRIQCLHLGPRCSKRRVVERPDCTAAYPCESRPNSKPARFCTAPCSVAKPYLQKPSLLCVFFHPK